MQPNIIKPEKSKFIRYFKSFFPFWKEKNIGFCGVFGHGDLGDDASFFVARDILGGNIVPVSKRCYAFAPHRYKAFLIGGGGILRWRSPYIPRRIFTRKKFKFPICLFSAGINCDYNKIFSEETKVRIKMLCEVCSYISVRDKISQNFLANLGVKKINILPDLELILRDKEKVFDIGSKDFTVGIVLTPHSEFDDNIFEKMVKSFSEFTNYLTEKGYNVAYIPFENKVSEDRKEQELISEISRRIKHKNKVKVIDNDCGPEEILYFMKNYCNILVCTRLHSAIFATNACVPFFCLTYNVMHDGFLEMIEAPNLGMPMLKNLSFNALREKFEDIFKNSNDIKLKLTKKRDSLRELIYQEISNVKRLLI